MTHTIFGHKIGMGEVYSGNTRVAVTAIQVFPAKVTQVKTVEKDGYSALQIEFGPRHRRQEIAPVSDATVGTELDPITQLEVGQTCRLQGVGKGKGYAGGVKRWGFAGGPRTHGQSDRLRAPGSIGQGTTPGRVYKGKHMAGRMGSDTITLKNVKIAKIEPEKHILWVSGPVPGARQSLVRLEITQGK